MRFTRSIELYPHQEEAVQWMFECSEQEPFGGILAHDMGLGKTIDILYFIANQDEDMIGSNLIVVPSNLIRQWADEFANYVEDIDNYDLAVYTTRAKPKNIHKFRVVLTTYDTLISDHKKGNETIFGISWNRIFLDEAHEIRNSKTIRNQVIMRLEGESKWCMTGTPIWNCKDDLDSLKRFISPERPSLVTRDLIHIRTKEILVLPKYNQHDCECHFNRYQYESYKRLEKRILRQSLVGEAKKKLLGNIIRLRRLCNHTEGEESAEKNISDWGKNSKFKKVNDILRKVPDGEKIVIFSSWLTSLLCIKKNLKELGYNKISMFHGELSMEDRQKELKKFRDGDNNILLITVKCGGVGLNLVCANHIIIFEPQYSPFAEKQAIDRVYRIGQQKEVFVYRLYMKSTIENWMNSIKDWKSVVKRIQLDGSSESEEGALESKIKAFQTYVTLDEKVKKLMEQQELTQKELETKADVEETFEII
jgi:transcription termination factor 2